MPLGFILLTGFLLEIFMLVAVGSQIGALLTVVWVILSAMIGMTMMQDGSRRAVLGMQHVQAVEGEDPGLAQVRVFANSTILMFGGILLLLPGFITDALGLFTLIPPIRALMIRSWTHSSHWKVYATGHGYAERDVQRVIEGEYRRTDD